MVTYIISYILFFFNCIAIFFKKNINIVIITTLLFMTILFSANYQNPDYFTYLNQYNIVNDINTESIFFKNGEFGFYYLIKIFSKLGFTYNQFLFFIVLVCMILIHSTVNKYTRNNGSLFYILYFIYPFLMDIVQVRNFILMSILIFSSKYICTNSIENNCKFIISILFAGLFQILAYVYLPFVFLNKIKRKKTIKSLMIFMITLSIIIALNSSFLNMITNFFINNISNIEKIESLNIRVHFGFLVPFFLQTFIFLTLLWSRNILKNKKKLEINLEISKSEFDFFNMIYLMNIMSFIYLPFYMISSNFDRIIRNLMPLYYIAYLIIYPKIKKKTLLKLVYLLMMISISVGQFIYYIYIPYKESIVLAIFKYNLIF